MLRLILGTVSRTMSKQSKSKKGGKSGEAGALPPPTQGPIGTDKKGNVTIRIAAKPGAKINSITGIDPDEGVGVQISAPPVEGEANTELLKYLAVVLGVRKSNLTLDRGSKSRQKTVLLSDSQLTPRQVEDIITKSISK